MCVTSNVYAEYGVRCVDVRMTTHTNKCSIAFSRFCLLHSKKQDLAFTRIIYKQLREVNKKMQCSPSDDNDSILSDDSNVSFSAQKEKLDSLINMGLKHSGVYCDIHFKDNLLKVDLENLCNTCQRLESQIKKKSEQLDDLYDKLGDDQKNNKAQLEKRSSSISQELAEINTLFCEAFDLYSYDVSKDTFEFLKTGNEQVKENDLKMLKDLSAFQQREKINDYFINTKSTQASDVNSAVDMFGDMLMKRPEIKLEEANKKLIQEIRQLQQRF